MSYIYEEGEDLYQHKFPSGKMNPLYRRWCSMKSRCYNEKSPNYERYGHRGIAICDEWLNFKSFVSWLLNNGFKKDLEIDRVDNNGNYSPENCRLVTHKQNIQNREFTEKHRLSCDELGKNAKLISKPIFCETNGKTYASIKAAEKDLSIKRRSITKVLYGLQKTTHGYKFTFCNKEDAYNTKKVSGKKIYCYKNNKIYESMSHASKELNINLSAISRVCNKKQKETKGGFIFRFVG